MTFIAALRCDRIDAPFVFDQPINAASFTAWVEEHLCPTLMPGDIVVMDNLSSHKKPAVRAAIRARGARLDLSRFCAAPLITYCAAKEMNHEHRQDG